LPAGRIPLERPPAFRVSEMRRAGEEAPRTTSLSG
jgi:hypothetical protein